MYGHAPATDAFIEASGSDAVLTGIIDRAGPRRPDQRGGAALQPGAGRTSCSVLMKELTIRGSIEYPTRFADAIDLLTRRDLSGAHHRSVPTTTRSMPRWSCSARAANAERY